MKDNIVRFSQLQFEQLKDFLKSAGNDETMAYALCSMSKSPNTDVFICNKLIIPDENEISNQSGASIQPKKAFQANVRWIAYELGLTVIDIHTHPFSTKPCFSGIDTDYGKRNATDITQKFPEPATMGMIVFGEGIQHYDACIWNRRRRAFEEINRIEIHGSPITVIPKEQVISGSKKGIYARHEIIPNWNQELLEDMKVFVCGLGGNGSLIFESLAALGIGKRNGWIKACDPDVLEDSNLPRIPYAFPDDVGRPKSDIAEDYAIRKDPNLNVRCYRHVISNMYMTKLASQANLIINAVDNDGARKNVNNIAARYMIPLIDVGTEIIPEDDTYSSIGQVQVFIPEKTGCLLCSGLIDPAQAAIDNMSDEGKKSHAQVGYVRGTNETPTPSVLHLNGVLSHIAISQALRLVFGESVIGKEFLHYNRQNYQITSAALHVSSECPICGDSGNLSEGDERNKVLPSIEVEGHNQTKNSIKSGRQSSKLAERSAISTQRPISNQKRLSPVNRTNISHSIQRKKKNEFYNVPPHIRS